MSYKGIHSNILSFLIPPVIDPKSLIFIDASDYLKGGPETPLLDILLPGYNKFFQVNIKANSVNSFNSSSIGLNQVVFQGELMDLPDGIWEFKYKICPYKYNNVTQRHLRTTKLRLSLAELHDRIDLISERDIQTEKTLAYINILIAGGEEVVNIDCKKSQEYYQTADQLVKKLLDKYCKNCN